MRGKEESLKKDPYVEMAEKQRVYHIEHGYKWIAEEVVEEYQKKYKEALKNGGNEVDEKVRCCTELKNIYGITELEATNILNGFHVQDYVSKYDRIQKLIPIKRIETEEDE